MPIKVKHPVMPSRGKTVIVSLSLHLARKAKRDEIANRKFYDVLYSKMTKEERKQRGASKPTDLAPDNAPGKNVVYSETLPLYNETFTETGRLQIGIPGATERMQKIVAGMLNKHARAKHLHFYVTAEILSQDSGTLDFRTVVARTEIPKIRNLGHRDLRSTVKRNANDRNVRRKRV
jgi:hypothetical protein